MPTITSYTTKCDLTPHTRISVHTMVQPRGPLGWLGYLLPRVQLTRVAAQSLDDLQHYVEHGRPSPRKRRQLATAKR